MQDPIGLAGGNPTLYGYVGDVNVWVDVLGLACSKAQRKLNKKNGAAAEDLVYDKLLSNPDIKVLGRHVYIKTPGAGRGRYVDILAQNTKTGKLINVEVKSGGASRSSLQIAKDKIINSGGGMFGKNAPVDMNGISLANSATTNMTTSVSNVPLWKL